MIRQRGDSYQADVAYGGKRVRKSFKRLDEAEEWQLEMKKHARSGGHAAFQTHTMQDLFEATCVRYWDGSKSEAGTTGNGKLIVSLLGESTPISEIDAAAISGLMVKLRKRGYVGSTINRKLAALNRMLTHAEELGWIRNRPKVKRQKESKHRIRFFSAEEEAALLEFFTHSQRHVQTGLFITVLIDTGLRLSEGLGLRFSDIADSKVMLGHNTKSGKARVVPLTTRAAAIISANRKLFPDDEKIFPTLSDSTVKFHWREAREALGMLEDPQWVIHVCRHTFATRLVQRKVAIIVVQQLLGHASITETMKYAHVAGVDLSDAIATLNGTGYRSQKNVTNVTDHGTPADALPVFSHENALPA